MTYAEFVKQAALLDVGVSTDDSAPMKVEVDKTVPVRLQQPIDINLIPSKLSPESAALAGVLGGGTLGYLFGPDKKPLKLLATLAAAGAGGLGGYYGTKALQKGASICFLNKLAAVRPIRVDKALNLKAKQVKQPVQPSPTLLQMIRQFVSPRKNPGIGYAPVDIGDLTEEELEQLYLQVAQGENSKPVPSSMSNYHSVNTNDHAAEQ